jgi:hypothetical protein
MNRGKRKLFVTVALIVLSIVAAVLVELIGGAAGGASTPSTSSTHASTARLAAPPPSGSSASTGSGNYQTVGTHVNLRGSPSTIAPVITQLVDLGSPVTLSCYLRGTSVAGDPWWYRATFVSAHGYVSGFWVNTGPDPAKTHLPAC